MLFIDEERTLSTSITESMISAFEPSITRIYISMNSKRLKQFFELINLHLERYRDVNGRIVLWKDKSVKTQRNAPITTTVFTTYISSRVVEVPNGFASHVVSSVSVAI